MTELSLIGLSKLLSDTQSIRLHKTGLEHLLSRMNEEDPCYGELAQLMELSQQCENLEIQVKPEDAELINRFNALSDQLSYKLAAMNAI
ncbi:hypothetical protein F0223_21730 [Vibrio coralliilyticus]|uniref:hypothetical protein n=1 Tax=Vibrio coralliilyticus TaxID=190893 RepID=UPI00148C4B15|nr:hypothetical protein [Vibrio coralliilyticus]NOI20848.1 hypothetical protein [Vibrio coralliilyticus]